MFPIALDSHSASFILHWITLGAKFYTDLKYIRGGQKQFDKVSSLGQRIKLEFGMKTIENAKEFISNRKKLTNQEHRIPNVISFIFKLMGANKTQI